MFTEQPPSLLSISVFHDESLQFRYQVLLLYLPNVHHWEAARSLLLFRVYARDLYLQYIDRRQIISCRFSACYENAKDGHEHLNTK